MWGFRSRSRWPRADASVTCIDVSADAVRRILAGDSYISDVPSEKLAQLVADGVLDGDHRPASIADCDDVVLCVPTPLSRNREPDLSYVIDATRTVGRYLRRGHLVVLESTTYPGTTRDELGPVARGGLRARGRRRLPSRDVARAHRPGPRRSHDPHDAEGRRRAHGGLHRARLRAVRARGRHARARRARPRSPSSRSCSRTSSARSTSRSSTSSRCCATGSSSTSGRCSTRPRPSRSGSCRSGRARASAATACRSTRSTSPGRRARSTSRPSSSSSPARSTRTCPTSACRRSRAR